MTGNRRLCPVMRQPCDGPHRCNPLCHLVKSEGGRRIDTEVDESTPLPPPRLDGEPPLPALENPRWFHEPHALFRWWLLAAGVGVIAAISHHLFF